MEKQAHITKKHQRIRLKTDGQDALYQHACAGSEGWVRKQQIDHLGYPLVYVEWDKDHWAYNGESDKWALEAHFEPVEEEHMSDEFDFNPEEFANLMASAAAQYFGKDKEEVSESKVDSKFPLKEEEEEEDYEAVLSRATESAKKADSFLLITVARESYGDDDVPVLVPRVSQFYQSPEAGILLESQLSQLGAIAHETTAIDAIRNLPKDES